jgi:hypothetical protein
MTTMQIHFNDMFVSPIETEGVSIGRRFGIYSFWDASGNLIYLGMSTNMGSRIISSFWHRFRVPSEQIRCKVIYTETKSDAFVLEAYLIAKLKPPMNGSGVFQNDETTFQIQVPGWSREFDCLNMDDVSEYWRRTDELREIESVNGYAKNADKKDIDGFDEVEVGEVQRSDGQDFEDSLWF